MTDRNNKLRPIDFAREQHFRGLNTDHCSFGDDARDGNAQAKHRNELVEARAHGAEADCQQMTAKQDAYFFLWSPLTIRCQAEWSVP